MLNNGDEDEVARSMGATFLQCQQLKLVDEDYTIEKFIQEYESVSPNLRTFMTMQTKALIDAHLHNLLFNTKGEDSEQGN